MSDADRSDDSPRIAAVPYQPAGQQSGGVRPRIPPLWIALGALGLVMAAAVLFFYMARSVQLRIEPAGARIDGQAHSDGAGGRAHSLGGLGCFFGPPRPARNVAVALFAPCDAINCSRLLVALQTSTGANVIDTRYIGATVRAPKAPHEKARASPRGVRPL